MGLGLGILLGLGRGLPSAVDTYQQRKAYEAAQAERQEEQALRQAEFEERKRQADQAFQLDQRRLNASVTEMGNAQRKEAGQRSARQRLLQSLASTDKGALGEALRAAALEGGGQGAFADMDPDELTRLAALSTRETPEEREARELREIEARERLQLQYSERALGLAGGAGGRQTPDQAAARQEVQHAQTNVRGADRDFRRVMGRKPVISASQFFDRINAAPDTSAFNAAMDSWRADSTDAADTRNDAREELTTAEKVRDSLFPGLAAARGAPAAAAAPAAPQESPPLGSAVNGKSTLSFSRNERIAFAEQEFDALIAAGISKAVAARSIAAKWGIQILDP
jgi:hypothetical protein